MKFIRRYNLKKVLLISVFIIFIFLILSIGITKYFYKQYYLESNKYIIYLINEIKEEYPSVDEEEIIQKLNKDKINIEDRVLKKYGIDVDNTSALNSYNKIYHKEIIIVSLTTLSLIILLIIIYFIDGYLKNKEIRKITKTLEKVNQGNYELDLSDNCEGDISILKDEVYKTTLMLREKAEQSIKGKENLKDSIANISHQLKTPLTSILIMVDNMIEEDMDKKIQEEFLCDIRRQIENMNFLIVALLKLSRFDANVIEFKKEKINVKKILFEINKNLSTMSDAKNINIHIRGNNEVFINGDYNWEIEALTNIIKNCLEHTPKDKNIYITYNDNSFYTKIIIEDEGIGMSKEELKKIFNRFYKGKNSSQNSIGIGLALAKEIIEKDNGTINVKSKEGKGTVFSIKYFKKIN